MTAQGGANYTAELGLEREREKKKHTQTLKKQHRLRLIAATAREQQDAHPQSAQLQFSDPALTPQNVCKPRLSVHSPEERLYCISVLAPCPSLFLIKRTESQNIVHFPGWAVGV